MKAIPKKVKIGPITYKVTEVNDMMSVMEGQTATGSIDFLNCTIRLYSKMTIEKKWAVLMHEIMHAIDENFSLSLSEETTDRLAVGIAEVLTENKMGLL